MEFSNTYKEKIKIYLDQKKESQFRAAVQKANAVDAPVLIIGLGGSGLDTLLFAKKKIYDMLNSEVKSDGSFCDKPKYVEYLGIDTTESWKTASHGGIGFDESRGELCVCVPPNIGAILEHPELLPPYVSKWLDCSMPQSYGAIRQLGRLMLMQNIARVKSILEYKIKKLTMDFPSGVPLYVFVIAEITGGVGGGMFLDIPYLVKAIVKNMDIRLVQTTGFLFMPDVIENKATSKKTWVETHYANAFASLKELEYLMNIKNTGDVFEVRYGGLVCGSKDGKPYDVCTLLSSKNKDDEYSVLGKEGYLRTVCIPAEIICNLICDNFRDYKEGYTMSLNAWMTGNIMFSKINENCIAESKRPVVYDYTVPGIFSMRFPLEETRSYLIYKMYQIAEEVWEQNPGIKEIEMVEEYFHLSKDIIAAEAVLEMEYMDPKELNRKEYQKDYSEIAQLYEEMLQKQKEKIDENLNQMRKNLEKRWNDPENILNQYFKDAQKGPAFAQKCLFMKSYEGRSLIPDLRNYMMECGSGKVTEEELKSMQLHISEKLSELEITGMFQFGAGKKFERYVQTVDQFYRAKIQNYLFEQLQIFCRYADEILERKNDELYNVASNVLTELMPIFKSYESLKTEHQPETLFFTENIVDTPVFLEKIENLIDRSEISLDFQKVLQDFYRYLLTHTEKWKNENQRAIEELNDFFYEAFRVILGKSFYDFIDIFSKEKGISSIKYIEKIIEDSTKKAEIFYPQDQMVRNEQPVSFMNCLMVFLPNEWGRRREDIEQLLRSRWTATQRVYVQKYNTQDRIYFMNFISGTPLKLHSDIKKYYNTYMYRSPKCSGLHLYVPTKVGNQVSDIDWRELPSPYPESEWIDFFNPDEKAFNDTYREILQKAIEYGYVVEMPEERKMVLYYEPLFDLADIAKEVSLKWPKYQTGDLSAAQSFVRKMRKLLKKDAIPENCGKTFVCSGMLMDVDGTLKKGYEEMIFIKLYKLRNDIAKMVERHEEMTEITQNIEKYFREKKVESESESEFF